jgi:hypothetical protein
LDTNTPSNTKNDLSTGAKNVIGFDTDLGAIVVLLATPLSFRNDRKGVRLQNSMGKKLVIKQRPMMTATVDQIYTHLRDMRTGATDSSAPSRGTDGYQHPGDASLILFWIALKILWAFFHDTAFTLWGFMH